MNGDPKAALTSPPLHPPDPFPPEEGEFGAEGHLASPGFFEEELIAARLMAVALVLLVAYLIVVASASFPPALLDPSWQLRLSNVLLDNAPMPLLAIGLVHLAVYLDPANDALQARRQNLARWAIAASLGFLLLIPLQAAAAWKTHSATFRQQSQQIRAADQRLAGLQEAVSGADSLPDLQRRWREQQGPAITVNLSQPLPAIKAELLAVIKNSQQRLGTQEVGLSPAQRASLIQGTLRGILMALAFGLGFAALAQRPGIDLSVLQETTMAWRRLTGRNRDRDGFGNARASGVIDENYIDAITRADLEPDQDSPMDRR